MFKITSSEADREDADALSDSDHWENGLRQQEFAKERTGTNVILPDLAIKGTVKFKNDAVIDGEIEGEILSDGCVTVGEKATVRAEIHSASVVVEGCVKGNIHASDRLELMETGEVTGDVSAPLLSTEAGAVLVGKSSTGPTAPESPAGSDPVETEARPLRPRRSRDRRKLARA